MVYTELMMVYKIEKSEIMAPYVASYRLQFYQNTCTNFLKSSNIASHLCRWLQTIWRDGGYVWEVYFGIRDWGRKQALGVTSCHQEHHI